MRTKLRYSISYLPQFSILQPVVLEVKDLELKDRVKEQNEAPIIQEEMVGELHYHLTHTHTHTQVYEVR